MSHISRPPYNPPSRRQSPVSTPVQPVEPSRLTLSDRMLTLAQVCDRAGLSATAGALVTLACTVLEEQPQR
jgi:hypothetical protein